MGQHKQTKQSQTNKRQKQTGEIDLRDNIHLQAPSQRTVQMGWGDRKGSDTQGRVGSSHTRWSRNNDNNSADGMGGQERFRYATRTYVWDAHTQRSRKEDNRRQEAGTLIKFRCVILER